VKRPFNPAETFLRRPVAALLLAIALVLAGAGAYQVLPTAPLPEVDVPVIVVEASLPGANPRTMAAAVATPMERAMGSISGITALSSTSGQGSTSIELTFELDRDINDAARDVQAAINASRAMLPAGMPSEPTYRKVNPSQAPIMVLALASPNLPPGELYDAAATILAQKLSQAPGVGEVSVGGAALPAVRVQINPHALNGYGLALDEVRKAIDAANPSGPVGGVEGGDRFWSIVSSGQLRTPADYAGLVVAWRNDAPIRLGDVAQIIEATENRYSLGFHNDKPAVLVTIRRQPGANILATTRAIHASLPGLRELMPADSSLTVVLDRSPGVRATLAEAQKTLLISIVLVVAVTALFLGRLRAALVPSLAVPVTLIAAFAGMALMGFSLNNLSVTALIIAAGLVVDDAIVVLENITRHLDKGLSPLRAARRGVAEVGFTLVAMNIALVVVFVAILFMGGLVEKLFREFSLTLAVTVLLSLVVSLTLTPTLCARLAPKAKDGAPAGPQRALDGLREAYGRSLDRTLRHPLAAVGVLAVAIALTVALYIWIPKGVLPEQDTGQVSGFARGDDGISFAVMQPKIEAYRRLLLAEPAVADVVGSAGGDNGINNSSLMIRLKPVSERSETSQQVIDRLRAATPKIPGGALWLRLDQDIELEATSQTGELEVVLRADDLHLLNQWAPTISRAMAALPELTDVEEISETGNLQVNLDIDRDAAARLGVDVETVTSVLNNAFSQRQVATLYDALNQYRVILELEPDQTRGPEALEMVHVIAADGRKIPLSAFTTWSYSVNSDWVWREQLFAARSLGFSLAPGVSSHQAEQAIRDAMAAAFVPNAIQVRIGGGMDLTNKTLSSQPLLIGGVIVAVYIVLGVLYESLRHPLTILSTLPPAGLGALLALTATGKPLTLLALLGLFLLVGMVMKNAILMVDFALREQRRKGLDAASAISAAARTRLRPILMTNCAAILGALPLALGTGEGSEMRTPLGVTIIGGLLISQLLTFYIVPAVYVCLDGRALRRRIVQAQPLPASPPAA
jgi:multidrug efflux pump